MVAKLNETAVRLGILENLCNDLATAIIPADGKSKMFVQQSLSVSNEMHKDMEKNTRKQNECQEWFQQRKCRLIASFFGCVMKRRKISIQRASKSQIKYVPQAVDGALMSRRH